MPRKIKNKSAKPVVSEVKENPTSWTGLFKNYPRIIGMFILLLFVPPIGWIFTYKYSPYDKKTSLAIATVCTAFFVYAVFISPEHVWFDNTKLTRTDFCARYSENSEKLSPRLGLAIDEDKLSVDGENFTYKFNDSLELAGMTENNFVKQITITTSPENNDDSFITINAFGLVVATLNPELNQDKRGEVFRDLGMLSPNIDDFDVSTVRGRITYNMKRISGQLFFTAQINGDS